MRVVAAVHKAAPFHGAGAEYMLHEILVDWVKRGHECFVLFPDAPGPYRYDGITFGRTPNRNLDDVFRGADLVVTHLDLTGPVVRAAAIATRPLVHLVHNDRQLQFHNVAPGPDVLVVPNSEWIAKEISPKYHAVICRPPVGLDRYTVTPAMRLGRSLNRITLVNVTSAKGSSVLFYLAQSEPNRHFLGVAGAYGIPARPPRRYANLELIGQTPEMARDVYARTRVLLMPSSYESWGRVAIEAGVSGIPVIASPTPGLLEALGDAGIFANPSDLNAWRDALKALDDPEHYAERSAAMQHRARELAGIAVTDLDRLERTTLELLEEHRSRLGASYHPHQPMFLDTLAASVKCPVCGRNSCSCGPTGDAILDSFSTIRDAPKSSAEPPRVYKTWRGDFRYNTAGAMAAGLIPNPDSDVLVSAVARRLGDETRRGMKAYATASPSARAAFLEAVNLATPRALAERLSKLLESLESSRSKRSAPSARVSPGPAAAGDNEADGAGTPPIDGRVGDVLEWCGTDRRRIIQAITAEKAGRARPTLLAKLQALRDEAA